MGNATGNAAPLNISSNAGNARQVSRAAGSKPASGSPEARLRKACTEFESVFISMIMRKMMDSIPKSSPSSTGSAILTGIADQPVAEHLAKSGGMGIADMMYKQLSRTLLQGQLPDRQIEEAARLFQNTQRYNPGEVPK